MTKLLIFSDIHKDWQALRKIINKKADVYICLGDLSSWGHGLNEGGAILKNLRDKLWILPGNNETGSQVKDLCKEYNFTFFHKKFIKLDNYYLAGFGFSGPMHIDMPGIISEEEIGKGLKEFADLKNLLLFTHTPPRNTTLDKIHSGIHGGSLAVKEFIEENEPLYCFSGHVHENAGRKEKIGKTTCFLVGKEGMEFLL